MMPIQALLQDRWWWCPMCGPGWGWGMMIFVWLFWIALIALVVWLVWRMAVRGGTGVSAEREDRAEALLRERYARGEIDRESFGRMLEDLRRGRET